VTGHKPITDERDMLPALHDAWLRAVTGAAPPEESAATCERCAMCQHPGEPPPLAGAFSAETKCCTYTPRLPSFVVGRILADGDGDAAAVHGRETVRARLAERIDATPLALEKPRAYQLIYSHATAGGGGSAFGRSLDLRCPHFVAASGGCGIWRHRETVCATWFCKHVRGAVGRDFWQAARRYLRAVEDALAWHAALELGIAGEALARLTAQGDAADVLDAASLGGPPDEAELEARWGDWAGREASFYLAAWEAVRGLGAEDVRRLGGVVLEAHARVVRAAAERLAASSPVPTRAHARGLTVLASDGDRCAVGTYSPYDPVELPRALVPALSRFDGRPTAVVLAELEREDGLSLTEDLLSRLADFGVLRDGV
jgi:hypothetical protein